MNFSLLDAAVAIGMLSICATALTAQAPRSVVPDSAEQGTSMRDAPAKTFFVRRDLAYTGVALAGSVVVSQFDLRIAHWARRPSVQGDSARQDLVSTLTRVNETPLTLAAAAAYGVGRLTHASTVADVGLHTFEALVLTTGVSQVVRGAIGRTRPRSGPEAPFLFKPGTGFSNFETRSFPSLHTAAAFATASALVGEIAERRPKANRYAAPLLYTAAVVPGLTRVYLDQHWASDIVAGAFVGALLGSRTVRYAHSHRRNKLDRALLGLRVVPDGAGGTLIVVSIPL